MGAELDVPNHQDCAKGGFTHGPDAHRKVHCAEEARCVDRMELDGEGWQTKEGGIEEDCQVLQEESLQNVLQRV